MQEACTRQVRLLLHILDCLEYDTPDKGPLFALKGGTALNLFVQPFPRLSVDKNAWLKLWVLSGKN